VRLLAGSFRLVHRNRGWLAGLVKIFFRPVAVIGRWAFRYLFVHLYRLGFLIRRILRRLGIPAKGKVMAVLANRYVAHAAVAGIVFFVSASNMTAREVRADTPGEKSALFSLLSGGEGVGYIEEVAADPDATRPVSYWGSGNLVASPGDGGTDDINFEEEAALNSELANGSAVLQPALPEDSPSTAQRTKIEYYVVRPGDSLNGIAQRFGVSAGTILWENNLTARDVIRPGDRLTILPVSGVSHTVKKGDTLSKIASRYDSEMEKILAWNSPGVTAELRIGDKIIVPDGAPPAPPAPPRLASVRSIVTPPAARGNTGGSGKMAWPTAWRVITQYFRWRHSGVDIDGDYNTPIYAADAGVVTHSGWGRTKGGYGIYIDIDHGNGLLTRYGHASKIFVKAGDEVARGQSIGMVGTTGRSTGTHVHFEVIRGGRKMNPLEYIR